MSQFKKLSASFLIQQATAAFKRFPLSLLCALASSVILWYWLEFQDFDDNLALVNVLLSLGLGIPLFFGVQMFAERRQLSRKQSIVLNVIFLVILALIWWTLPGEDVTTRMAIPYYRYGILNLAAHLVVSFIPFTTKLELNGFWNYNKELFIRFFTSAIYSGILYGGLSLAILAVTELFDLHINEEIYGHLFFFALFMNTLFFTSGIGSNLNQFEEEKSYPKPLRFVVQFLLIPILVIYLLILYAYGAKAIVLWEWPEGILSWLVCIIAVFGILSLLLGYPYSNQQEHGWMKKFERIYYYALFPLIGLLFYACAMRIGSYGLTINRCILLVIGSWLLGIALYFSFGNRNIKVVPITLALTFILVSFGPWSIFNMSERSQVNRIENILAGADLLTPEGTIKNETLWVDYDANSSVYVDAPINNKHLNAELRQEVYGITQYLMVHHGYEKLDRLFQQNLDQLLDSARSKKKHLAERMFIMEILGLNARNVGQTKPIYYPTHVNYRSNSDELINLKGMDYLAQFNRFSSTYDHEQCWELQEKKVCLRNGRNFNNLVCYYKGDTVCFDASNLVRTLSERYGKERSTHSVSEELVLKGTPNRPGQQFNAMLYFSNFELKYNDDLANLNSIQGHLGVTFGD